jgi:hypothetical protein
LCWTIGTSRLPFLPASTSLQIAHRIRRDQLSLVDDDHLLAGLLHFRKNVCAENDGVIARKAFDQISSLIDLLRVQSGRGLIKNEDIRVVNNGLRQADALPVTFGEFAKQLVLYIGNGASLANVINSLLQL